jgi:tRNA dimethylallyltransferase
MPDCIFLLGATGVGKSDIALELARRRGAAILALDAMQVYGEADIGVGKPTAAERAEIHHGGIDLVPFGAAFDVARYVEQAIVFLREQVAPARPVLIVGGTGLYFRALSQGLCEAPPAPDYLREELAALSIEQLRERLQKVDPTMIPRLDIDNPRRLIRAIAVMETTGRSLRAWQDETPVAPVKHFKAMWLQRTKEDLQGRLESRVHAMLKAGWIDEVRGLIERHGAEAVRRFPGIGYRELTGHLTADTPLDFTRHAIVTATRQYAKRQLTWFNREPTLTPVMLSGAPPVPVALSTLL